MICGWWLNMWTEQICTVCRKNNISDEACEQLTNAFLAKRWKVYLYVWMFIFFVCLVAYIAKQWKRQFPTYWRHKWDFRNVQACFGNERDFHEEVCLYDSDERNDQARRQGEIVREQIQELFDATTRSADMGVGYDGSFQNHKSFKVLKVERIENARNWKKYAKNRSTTPTVEHITGKLTGEMQEKAARAQNVIDNAQRAMRQTAKASKFIKSLRLDASRNEVLLFHGSPGKRARNRGSAPRYSEVQFQDSSPVDAISLSGFDQRLGSSAGMLGSAIYFADKASKADCYAGKYGDEGQTTVGEKACIFISRVTLGCSYLADHSLNGIRRPPSTHEEFDAQLLFDETPIKIPQIDATTRTTTNTNTTVKDFWTKKRASRWIVAPSHHERFTSVISHNYIDGTTPAHYKRYNEYAVYHGTEAYPEFKVTYERMSDAVRRTIPMGS